MTEMAAAREAVARQLANVRELDGEVIRGEKIHNNKCYAIAYVDLADDIVTRANHLQEFQERILGDDFFESPEQLRWNNYLYLVAGPRSVASEGYHLAKAQIEANRDYARKRVVSEEELVEFLGDSMLFESDEAVASEDVVTVWATKLRDGGLDGLLNKPTPRTDVIESIGKGTATHLVERAKAKTLSERDQDFTHSLLRSLEVTRFRHVHDGKQYQFGNVTLIIGPNGSGKTSLLEAIEYLYCGHNRRPTGTGHLSVKGTCSVLHTGKSFEVSSTNDTARIKTRNLSWYRRDAHQAKSILDGFTRYNFLDTDAAFRLSTELEPSDISDDLSRLLIGSEASALWEYLGKVTDDLDAAQKRTLDRLSVERERASLFETEVGLLKVAPSQANSLSKTYRVTLRTIGWLGTAKGPDDLVAKEERRELEELATWISELLSFSMPVAASNETIRSRVDEIQRALALAEPEEAKRKQAEVQIDTCTRRVADIDAALVELDNWLAYCVAEFPKTLQARSIAHSSVESIRRRLGRFLGQSVAPVDIELAKVSIAEAEAAARRLMESSILAIESFEAAEKNFGALEAAHAKASQQLKDAASALLKEGHSARACPVCGTDHEPDDLLRKIEQITARGAVSSEPLQQLQQGLEKARTQLAGARQRMSALATLRQVAAQLGLSEAQSIGEIEAGLKEALLASERADGELASVFSHIAALESAGLTEKKFAALRSSVKQHFADVESIDQVDVVAATRVAHVEIREELNNRLEELRVDLDSASAKVLSVIRSVESMDWPAAPAKEKNYGTLSAMLKQAKSMEALAVKVTARIDTSNGRAFTDLRSALDGAIEAFDRALHAVSTETFASQTLEAKELLLKQARTNVSALNDTLKRQMAALGVLEGLIRDHSLEGATREALEAIQLQINDVFSRIHSPREYEYAGSNEHLLVTSEGHTPRTLDEVSTGQRAAFALSIFLALNLTAKSAPPLLLIDDPIAHIDDLNALSFLDYLRDLAIHARRQIFFATADSRIAALFEKKFAFLGDHAFRKIVLGPQSNA